MITITNLFFKAVKGAPMVASRNLELRKGYGIVNDVNACPISPRQILLTRQEDLDELSIRYGGLRENLIIAGCPSALFVPGAMVSIGTALIRLTFYCEPCKRIADAVPSMNAVLNRRGILGVVLNSGQIHVGEELEIEPGKYPPVSETPYERFLLFVRQIPPSRVVNYKMICQGMGVAESYIRAIPKYIEKASYLDDAIPIHRIVDSAGGLLTDYIPEQENLLRSEGIIIIDDLQLFESKSTKRTDLARFQWGEDPLFLS
ncbi:MGMT family protein [Mucilaginibacter sp. CAU 1740]|uniref:MGMT family protein n=1 Tax=Mucilaginibacter sp. CAU 1740 TaxID=3140365 RepID=UPI00325AFDA5